MPSRPRSSQQVLDDFQAAYPNIKVTFEPVAGDYAAAMAAKFSSGDVAGRVLRRLAAPRPTWIDDGVLEPLDDYIAKTRLRHERVLPGLPRRVQGPRRQDLRPAQGRQHDRDGLQHRHARRPPASTAPPTNWEELTAAVDKLKGTEGLDAPCACRPQPRPRARVHLPGRRRRCSTRTRPPRSIDTPESVTGIETYLGFFKSGAAKRPADIGRRLVRQVPRRGPRRRSSSRAAGSTRT